MKVNKFKIESWDDLDKYYLDAEEQQEYIRDSYKRHFEKIHPLSGEYIYHYENFSIEKLEEVLEALANNKTDDRRDI